MEPTRSQAANPRNKTYVAARAIPRRTSRHPPYHKRPSNPCRASHSKPPNILSQTLTQSKPIPQIPHTIIGPKFPSLQNIAIPIPHQHHPQPFPAQNILLGLANSQPKHGTPGHQRDRPGHRKLPSTTGADHQPLPKFHQRYPHPQPPRKSGTLLQPKDTPRKLETLPSTTGANHQPRNSPILHNDEPAIPVPNIGTPSRHPGTARNTAKLTCAPYIHGLMEDNS